MKYSSLIDYLDELDSAGKWLFTMLEIRRRFNESESSLMSSTNRHVKAGLIKKVCRGLYSNDRARSKPELPELSIASVLRCDCFSYVSFESALWFNDRKISKPKYLSIMTHGRSQYYDTCYGGIKFTHTKRTIESVLPQLNYSEYYEFSIANSDRAEADIRKIKKLSK